MKRHEVYRVSFTWDVTVADPKTQDARDAVAAVMKWVLTKPDSYQVRPAPKTASCDCPRAAAGRGKEA